MKTQFLALKIFRFIFDALIFFLGTWQDRVDVAIKQLRDDRMDNAGGYEKAKEEFFKEARIFKLMNHPNLVQVRFYV